MKTIYQKHDKDCLQACLATILKIPYNEIPEFYKTYPGVETKEGTFVQEYDTWLESKGYRRFQLDASLSDNKFQGVPYFSGKTLICMAMLKEEDRYHSHAVVIEICSDHTQVYDPREDSDYEMDDLIQIEILVRL